MKKPRLSNCYTIKKLSFMLKKKSSFILVLLVLMSCVANPLHAQYATCNFAFNIGTSAGLEDARSVTYDAAGNMYIVGRFTNTANFNPSGTNTITADSTYSGYLAKYDCAGNYQWAIPIAVYGICKGVATDATGNVYVTGNFSGMHSNFNPLGTPIVLSTSSKFNQDVFIAKYNTNGICQWANSVAASGTTDAAQGIAVDLNGNAYITGEFSGTNVDFNPAGTTIPISSNGGSMDAFVAKYNTNGIAQWAFPIGSASGNDRGWAITTDADSNVLVTGELYTGTNVNFNPLGTAINLTGMGSTDIFLAKYNTNGIAQWAFLDGGATQEGGYAVATDKSNNVYIGGYVNAASNTTSTVLNFNPSGNNTITVQGNGSGGWIAKYNSSGVYQWALPLGNGGFSVQGLNVDADSNIFITGLFRGANVNFNPLYGTNNISSTTNNNSGYLAKYDSTGANLWAVPFVGTSGYNYGFSVATDGLGNITVVGDLAGTSVNFNPYGYVGLSTFGSDDIFAVSYFESKTWNGNISSDWSNNSNWTTYGVPALTDNIRYPSSGITNPGSWTGSNFAKGLNVLPGASLIMPSASTLNMSRIIRNNGSLSAAGATLVSSVYNAGNLYASLGSTINTLNVTGNHTNGIAGNLNIQVAGISGAGVSNGNDQLVVSGIATLGDTLNVSFISPFVPIPGQSFTILTATSVQGTFSTLKLPANIYGNLVYSPTSVVLNITYPLPVTLVSFTAQQQYKNVLLNWHTVNEVNNDHYTVQYSKDGSSWVNLSVVAGKDQTNNTYSYIHLTPQIGINYYRLQQVDKDGATTYSDIKTVTMSTGSTGILSAYPNPIRGNNFTINIGKDISAAIPYSIYTLDGRLVQQGVVNNRIQTINLATAVKGTYTLKLSDGESINLIKL